MMDLSYKRFFKTLGNENRLKIITLLATHGPTSVMQIVESTGLEQSAVSHNLHRLLSCHFVEVQPNGRERVYKVNEETIKPLLSLIDKHVQHYCAPCVACEKQSHSSMRLQTV